MDERDTGDEHVRTCAKVLAALRVGRVLKKGGTPPFKSPTSVAAEIRFPLKPTFPYAHFLSGSEFQQPVSFMKFARRNIPCLSGFGWM